MTTSPILIDSSWYTREIKVRRNPAPALLGMAGQRDLATCGVVQCEVGRGLKEPKLRQILMAHWAWMRYVETDQTLWQEAEKLLYALDRQGIILGLPDVLIACCARRIGAVVLTYDKHFELIPGIRATDRIY